MLELFDKSQMSGLFGMFLKGALVVVLEDCKSWGRFCSHPHYISLMYEISCILKIQKCVSVCVSERLTISQV